MSTRVIVADDHAIVRRGLKALLQNEDDIDVVAEASNCDDLYKLILRKQPDVAVIDWSMPGGRRLSSSPNCLRNQPVGCSCLRDTISSPLCIAP